MTVLVLVCHTIWLISTIFLWTLVDGRSELARAGRALGPYRAAIDVVESMMEDFGVNMCAYSDAELQHHLRKRKLRIKYYSEDVGGERPPHVGLSSLIDNRRFRLQPGVSYGGFRFNGFKRG
jgi:hypothetical protein